MGSNNTIYDILRTIVTEDNVVMNKQLREHTYTRLGGAADYFVTPKTFAEVQAIVELSRRENIPYTLLGNGSNLIIKDGGIRGIVICFSRLNQIDVTNEMIVAESGARIIEVSREAYRNALTGLEFACGIPGSVGGALYMNAGAYGGEIKDVLMSAKVMTKEGIILDVRADELELEYRTSNIPQHEYIVLEATFRLAQGDQEAIKSIMDDLTNKRESKQPLEYPSCGSVFKRPPGYFAGKLIQDSGLQGVQIGGAQVSEKHAGFIVNKAGASAEEYISLIQHVQKTVYDNYQVSLEREVKIIGEDPIDVKGRVNS